MRTKVVWNHTIYNVVHHNRFINKAFTDQFNPVYQQLKTNSSVLCPQFEKVMTRAARFVIFVTFEKNSFSTHRKRK